MKERDLDSPSHDAFARAIVKCQSGDPSWCVAYGMCRRAQGGASCFGSGPATRAKARAKVAADIERREGLPRTLVQVRR